MYKFYYFGNIFSAILSLVIFIVFFIFSTSMLITLIKERAKIKQNLIEYLLSIVLISVSSVLLFSSLLGVGLQISDYVIPYKNGNCETVCGKIENLDIEQDQRYVRFSVDGEEFEFHPRNVLYIGIKNKKYIKENEEVKITYVVANDILAGNSDKQNVIMEIELT